MGWFIGGNTWKQFSQNSTVRISEGPTQYFIQNYVFGLQEFQVKCLLKYQEKIQLIKRFIHRPYILQGFFFSVLLLEKQTKKIDDVKKNSVDTSAGRKFQENFYCD